jgi:TRAP-type C4-dicarboxylate transport system permease small subunit
VSEASDVPPEAPADPALSTAEPETVVLLRRLDRALGVAEVALLCVFLAVLIGVALWSFISGHLLDKNPTWTDELIRASVFFTAWTGAVLAAQTDQLLNMDLITRLVKPRTKLIIRGFTRLLTIGACVLLIHGGLVVHGVITGEHYEVISTATVALALPLGAALVGTHVLLHLAMDVIYLIAGRTPPESEHIPLH